MHPYINLKEIIYNEFKNHKEREEELANMPKEKRNRIFFCDGTDNEKEKENVVKVSPYMNFISTLSSSQRVEFDNILLSIKYDRTLREKELIDFTLTFIRSFWNK